MIEEIESGLVDAKFAKILETRGDHENPQALRNGYGAGDRRLRTRLARAQDANARVQPPKRSWKNRFISENARLAARSLYWQPGLLAVSSAKQWTASA